ncbi:uncharacterized protein METZ01_LOCUS433218, partial [marine metagenome]
MHREFAAGRSRQSKHSFEHQFCRESFEWPERVDIRVFIKSKRPSVLE